MSVIDEIKTRLDIVDVVSQYVALQRSGRNFRGLCPFHTERTPSFYVSPERQTWHCFGACAAGGDLIEFVKRRENVDFREALRLLAERAGVALADKRSPEEEERYERLFAANEAAATFFNNALRTSRQAEAAREYLRSRGLDTETVEAFQIGYGPDEWEALKSHLKQRGFTDAELIEAGLLVESDRGGYDRFRGRIMFPIRDERGRVAGFGGRVMQGASSDTGAKYLNTPRSPIFDKSRLLYGLDRASDAVRREQSVVVVEGYMDAIAAHQHGVTNVVASMGTALTEAQIKALERFRSRFRSRFPPKIMLALDADAAGIEATLRALQEAEHAGVIRATPDDPSRFSDEEFGEKLKEWSKDALRRAAISVYVVPLSGKDPDEMIRHDRSAWDAAVADAKPFTDHIFDVVAARTDRSQPAQRAALLQELLPVVRLIEEPAHRAHYVQRCARLAQVRESDVLSELRRRPGRSQRDVAEPVAITTARAPREHGEEFLLALLLRHVELRGDGARVPPDLFLLSEHRAIFEAWLQRADLEAIRPALPEDVHPQLDRILARDLPALDGAQMRAALEGCVAKIQKDRLRQKKLANASVLSDPEMQVHVAPAVQEAITLRAGSAGSTESDGLASQLAASLVEDDEMGRRLHQTSSRGKAVSPDEATPRSEGTP